MEFLKLSSLKLSISCLFLFFLTACGLFQPYIDRQRNPGVSDLSRLYTGPSTPERPVICYNGWLTSDEEENRGAAEVTGNGRCRMCRAKYGNACRVC